jgi:hypothetical protein
MGVHLKRIAIFSLFLRPIPDLTTCPSSPAAREPISVAILFNPLRKTWAKMQNANVSHGKAKMDKMGRRSGLPCVRHSRCCIKSEPFEVRRQCRLKKKVMEKQRRSTEWGWRRKRFFIGRAAFEIRCACKSNLVSYNLHTAAYNRHLKCIFFIEVKIVNQQ